MSHYKMVIFKGDLKFFHFRVFDKTEFVLVENFLVDRRPTHTHTQRATHTHTQSNTHTHNRQQLVAPPVNNAVLKVAGTRELGGEQVDGPPPHTHTQTHASAIRSLHTTGAELQHGGPQGAPGGGRPSLSKHDGP